ncbi:related to methyltransferase [Phialocephala subalpina]|uniref:Related to methyltransferase n=1 Tax=Phialocephala subalpina TaxID=576137 RepID=A0A1L7XM44_9HELO|nr:related to methyltransferase [Phialocephala subalpina]
MTALPSDSAIYVGLSEEQQAAQPAETSTDIDNGVGISDTGYETDSVGTAATSLASSVRDYVFENGRRYHKFREGSYNFPNDEPEQDREDMTHALVTSFCHRLHFAPIETNPQNILDMGTGTGIWGIAMGDQYPSANILGVDLSPIQPSWVPPNVRLMVDDVESPWLYPRHHFDYIHSRHMVMAIRDWPKLMRQALEHLKPGGWMEMQEIHYRPYCHDGSMPPDHLVAEYWSLVSDGLASLGVNSDATILLADMMRDAGFTNVTTRIFHVPIGRWPKNRTLKAVGLCWRAILLDGVQAIALGPMTRALKWRREQVEMQLVEVRKGYMDEQVHSHMPLHIIYGQKPRE